VLRQKLARWATDNAPALRDAKPIFPPGFNNRSMENWRLLLAIAELAGGDWPAAAREAAERLSNTRYLPSYGVRLLAAFKEYFANTAKKMVTSEEMVAYLSRDPTSVWIDYNHGGPITQRQIAILLDQYDIGSKPLHPTGRKDLGRMGYEASQFVDAFARYTSGEVIIQSPSKKARRVKQRSKKRRSKKRR
jgi:putative DNA primase/helicase